MVFYVLVTWMVELKNARGKERSRQGKGFFLVIAQ
jgi:hypothetical protein